ncbi:hypothetical protein ACHAQH_000945 [Verticillium albo-atrum]
MSESRAIQLKEEGNRHFQKGDYINAEGCYSKGIIADPKNQALYTNRAMARLKLNYWDAVVADCRDALALNPASMKASYYLAQALVSLQDFDDAITAAMRAHALCIETGDRSLAAVTALVLRCKKERWEHKEKRRKREDQYLENDVVETMEREKERTLAATDSESERGDVAAECDAKIGDIRRVFETARTKSEQKREVPDWLIDDITFNVFVDPWVTKTGKSYERASIMEHLRRHPSDPLTREPLQPNELRPNLALRQAAEEFLNENGWAADCFMRLINVRTKEIKLFYGDDTPPYAILSHTWEGDSEVSYQEWTAPRRPTYKPGYHKIIAACLQAEQDGLDYLWVDTNCIDKTSSAELSEAINSMFAWYEASTVCYAYLSDVHGDDPFGTAFLSSIDGLSRSTELTRDGPTVELSTSRWFTRGWTLQELIAPPKLTFFNRQWKDIGTRQQLRFPISTITGIDVTYLGQSSKIFSASVAARLSWAAKRETTRVEDMAYCLLGIFDIHLPLIYGEGSKAFLRLQEEIIKNSDDQTIFCWTWESDLVPHGWLSLLAPSPAVFDSPKYVPAPGNYNSAPYQITNVGLRIRLPVVLAVHTVCAVLDVVSTDDTDPEKRRRMCLPLLVENNVYRRVALPGRSFPIHLAMVSEVRNLYILCKTPRNASGMSILPYRPRFEYGFHITVRVSGFQGNEPPLGVDCLVPQYPQSPFSHISTPVYSVVGFRGALQSDINILILRIKYKDQRIPILLSVGMRGGRPTWHCEILPHSFLAYNAEQWLVEIDKMREQSQGHSMWYHKVRNVAIALDQENLDTSGRYVRYVYIAISDRARGSRTADVMEDLGRVFDSHSRDRIYDMVSQIDVEASV